MAVGKQGSPEVTITFDDAPGGTPRVVTNFVMELGGVKIVVHTAKSDAFGDAWNEHSPTGKRSIPDIPIGGQFDTTTVTGPHVVFRPVDGDAAPNAATRTLTIVFGDAKTFTVECRIADYEVVAKNDDLTEWKATMRPSGAGVWS